MLTNSTINTSKIQDRFILVQLDEVKLLFSTNLVMEILIIEANKLLLLPFYPQGVLGCVQNRGQIIPLISLYHLLWGKAQLSKEKLKIVRLNENAGTLRGVGIVVDQLLGSQDSEQFLPFLDNCDSLETLKQQKMGIFNPKLIPEHLWHPNHWQPKEQPLSK